MNACLLAIGSTLSPIPSFMSKLFNVKIVNYLDVTLNLTTPKYYPWIGLDFETDCEILWCAIIIPSHGSKFLVGVFYRPPSSDAVYLCELQKSLSLIDRSGTNLPLLLLGDFNLPNITWGEVPKCHDALLAVFCDVVDDYFLQQMVFEPTRGENILDLILTNTPEFLMNKHQCLRRPWKFRSLLERI